MADVILVINAGSSSVKFSTFAPAEGGDPVLLFKGQMEGIGAQPHFFARDAANATMVDETYGDRQVVGHDGAMKIIAEWLRSSAGDWRLAAVGHRVVHGGPDLATPVLVDDRVMAKLEQLIPLAPLHQPANLAPMRAVGRNQPGLPQVACFDTAFHRGHPELADRFALPDELYRDGVRRYGFHGLSYEYIARALPRVAPEIANGRVIIGHLGAGASLCALKNGRSVDSTMGFTALDGLPMNTRCGAMDPGVVLHLIREKGLSPDQVEQLLYHGSGLRGLSGISGDVRELLASREPAAKFALDYFAYQVARQLGALAGVLDGIDALVFTAGIGERSAEMRARIGARAAWLGLRIDDAANRANAPCISARGSRVSAWVIPTDEEMTIARHTMALIGAHQSAALHRPAPEVRNARSRH